MSNVNRFIAAAVLEMFMSSLCPVWIGAQEERSLAPASDQPPSTEEPRTVSREVTSAGGRLALDGVELEIPAGAVEKTVTISITALPCTSQLSDGLMNVTSGAMGFRFEPHGMRFSRDVLVSIPFDEALVGSETALSNLFTYFYSEKVGRWERLPRAALDRTKAVLTSTTTHFTDMINATLTLPEGPAPLQFDMNSIKNLEAANPAAGIPTPQGLDGGPFGSASFSIDLHLPKGRGGATPSLALSYSSDSPDGWMGKGFDISASSISIDTRFGMPDYDGVDTLSLIHI